MKTYGLPATQELVSLHLASEDTPDANLIQVGEDRIKLETICPNGRYWQNSPDAPWNAIGADDSNPSHYLGDDGEPLLWTPPTIVPLVKLPEPAHDKTTHKADPVLVWYEDRVERDWQIVELTAKQISDRLPPYYETSAGIKLATQEHDQTAFTRMLALIDLTQMDPAEMVIIKDAAGEKHGVSVSQFKSLMAEYGAHCYSLHVGA